MKNLFTLVLFVTLSIFSVYAKNAPSNTAAVAPVVPTIDYPWMGKAEISKLLVEAKKRETRRAVASSIGAQSLQPDFAKFIDKFLAVKSTDALDEIIVDLDKNYQQHSPDLQYVAAQLVTLRKFRGLVYRITPLAKRERITYSLLLTEVKKIAATIKVYLPEDHAEMVFRYMTEPFLVNGQVVSQFKETWDFQNYLASEVYPESLKSLKRISEIKIPEAGIIWDNRITTGSTTFLDGVERYRQITDSDRRLTMSSMHSGMASLCILVAYNLDGLTGVIKEDGRLYGVDGFLGTTVEGVTLKDKAKIVSKSHYKYLYTLRSGGEAWTRLAFKHISESVADTEIAWESLRDLPANQVAAIDPSKINPWGRNIDRSLKETKAMLEGPTEIRNVINGDVVTVNMPEFFNNPPKDLKTFYPTAYDGSSEQVKVKGVKIPNYFSGRATNWEIKSYQPYFPSLKKGSDVGNAVRTLRQSWGGDLVGIPFARFVD